MSGIEIILLAVSVAAVVSAALVVYFDRRKTLRTLEGLDKLLDAAIAGNFTETVWDESLLSSVEAKLANYLAASEVSAKNLAVEKEKIASLIADISHQTKTPIANILLYTELLGEKNLPEDCRDCVTALTGQAEKLRFLIESLVKASRLETGILTLSPRPAPLLDTLEAVAEQIAPKAAAKDIRFTVGATNERAVFDPKWTAEALFNLADNAVKYTPSGGCITVRATPYELFCRIDVTDTGIGVSENEKAKIFQRFYRSPSVTDSEGAGIGLWLAREIVTGEGGYIRIESQKGSGSTFSVFLPRE